MTYDTWQLLGSNVTDDRCHAHIRGCRTNIFIIYTTAYKNVSKGNLVQNNIKKTMNFVRHCSSQYRSKWPLTNGIKKYRERRALHEVAPNRRTNDFLPLRGEKAQFQQLPSEIIDATARTLLKLLYVDSTFRHSVNGRCVCVWCGTPLKTGVAVIRCEIPFCARVLWNPA